jgi:hypothetical protein
MCARSSLVLCMHLAHLHPNPFGLVLASPCCLVPSLSPCVPRSCREWVSVRQLSASASIATLCSVPGRFPGSSLALALAPLVFFSDSAARVRGLRHFKKLFICLVWRHLPSFKFRMDVHDHLRSRLLRLSVVNCFHSRHRCTYARTYQREINMY